MTQAPFDRAVLETTLPPSMPADLVRELARERARREQLEKELVAALNSVNLQQAAFEDSQHQLFSITDPLPVLVSYIDAQGRYRFVNQTYERWFGVARETIVGHSLAEVLGAEAYAQLGDIVAQALAGRRVNVQRGVRYRHGGERYVDITYIPHRHTGNVHGFIALIWDITDTKRAEMAREVAALRSERLMRVTAAIADAVQPEQVLEAVVDRVAEVLGASSVGLYLLREDEHSCEEGLTRDESLGLELVREVGYPSALREACAQAEGGGPPPASAHASREAVAALKEAVREHAPLWVSSPAELQRLWPALAASFPAPSGGGARGPTGPGCLAWLPLGACGMARGALDGMARGALDGMARGALCLGFPDERISDPSERDFLLLVARYAGQAIARSNQLQTERALRAQSEAAAARLELSSRASSAFAAAGPQLGDLFRVIAEHVMMGYADGSCIVLHSDGVLELAAVAHRDAGAAAQIRESASDQPLGMGHGLLSQVVRTGVPVLLPEVNPDQLRRTVATARAAWLERYMPRSLVIVPMRAAGQVIGALVAIRHDAARPFSLDDQRLLEEIAGRAAVAIGAARLHEANEEGRVRAELLYELAAKVIQAKTVDDVFDAALDGIERALGASRCSILTFDAEGVMRFRAWRGLSSGYRAAVEGHSPWQRSAQSPQPIVVPDVQAEASLQSYGALFETERIGALGFIPLVSEGRLIGKFMVYYPLPRQLSLAELDMAGAIANHVAAAIGRFSALRELEQTVRFNEIFTGMLGHDLRNPLGAIMAAAQMAARRSDQVQLEKPLARIIKSGERMATMIDQLLDFTRVRVGEGIPIDPRPSDLFAIMGQAVDELSHAHPGWRFALHRGPGETAGVWDADRILQVFSNLVGNAVQHGSAEHGVSVFFDGSAPAAVSVRIHNVGAIPAELLPRLFEPMAGGDRRRNNSRGLGLGLYISREIAWAHGGEIVVATSATEGTSFTLRLPRVPPGAKGESR